MKLTRREILAATSALGLSAEAQAELFEVLADSPQQLQTPIEALDSLLTPTDRFFVRSHFGAPRWNPRRRLSVTGLVKSKPSWNVEEFRKLPQSTVTAVLQCAGNGRAFFTPPMPGVQWQHGAMGQAEWTGVKLAWLLERAGLLKSAANVHLIGADRPPKAQTPPFIRSLPLERALHPDTLVAWKMNGEPLTLEHGFPFRLVVPGWAGDHWLKWLVEVHVAQEEHAGFFVQKAYRIPPKPVPPGTQVAPADMEHVTVMPVKSIVTFPREGARLPAGKTPVRGIAFSGVAPIEKVEVSLDDGQTWRQATLQGEAGLGRWQRFETEWELRPGTHRALARATDASKAIQPREAVWNPSGYFHNAWHRVAWSAS